MSSDTTSVCRCGATAHATDPSRCANGHNRIGHPGPAFRHGVRSFEARGEAALPADLRVSVEEFRAQVISDRGGVDDLSAIEGGYIRRLAELETVSRLLASDLASRGIFTPRGRVRGTYSRWLETLDRWDRFAQRVGAERRPRPVPNLQEYLAARAEPDDDAPATAQTDQEPVARDADTMPDTSEDDP